VGWQLWGPEDIKRILISQAAAVARTPVSDEYWRGYVAALVSVAAAFGIELQKPEEKVGRMGKAIEGRGHE
jgi:hypothetical protein